MYSVFVWDDTAELPWELPYYNAQFSQRLAQERDLRDFQYPHGFSVKAIEPLAQYRLGYEHEGFITMDLTFSGHVRATPVLATASRLRGLAHLDQPGRVHGSIKLRGDRIDVDCHTVRDRSGSAHRPSGRSRRLQLLDQLRTRRFPGVREARRSGGQRPGESHAWLLHPGWCALDHRQCHTAGEAQCRDGRHRADAASKVWMRWGANCKPRGSRRVECSSRGLAASHTTR